MLESAIDTGGPTGRSYVLGIVADGAWLHPQFGQRAGIEAAKAKGIYKGRPATFDRARIVALRKEGMGATRSPRLSGANEGTSTRRSRLPGCLVDRI